MLGRKDQIGFRQDIIQTGTELTTEEKSDTFNIQYIILKSFFKIKIYIVVMNLLYTLHNSLKISAKSPDNLISIKLSAFFLLGLPFNPEQSRLLTKDLMIVYHSREKDCHNNENFVKVIRQSNWQNQINIHQHKAEKYKKNLNAIKAKLFHIL